MNRITPRFLYLALLVLIALPVSLSAQNKKQNTPGLLWRITGNGLGEPSYLYGTIHLTDKRVFNFGDSLYAAIEKSSGYAMELNPDSLMIEYFKEEEKDPVLLKDVISSTDFNRIKKKLQERFDKSPNKITVKEFKESFNELLSQLNENGSMQTIMDAYFYNVARQQGKWVGGIEDVSDQLPRREDNSSVDPYYIQDFIDDNKAGRRYLEEMIRAYTEEDITFIEKMSYGDDESAIDEVMLRRNKKMARRMDSLSHIWSMFFAVGSAHLPGDSGVISFLRGRGFTVEPVISSKRIHASNYHFEVKPIPWTTITSGTGLYSIDMPGEPQKDAVNYDYENMDIKMYADISTNLFYITMGVTGKEWKNEDSLAKVLVRNMNKKATIANGKEITLDGIRGKEFLATADKITYRIRLYFNSPNIYLTMVGSASRDGVNSEDANRFFKSLLINKHAVAKSTDWQRYTNTNYGFTVSFPGKPMEKIQNTENDETIKTTVFSALDIQRSIYFQVMIQDLKRGFYLTSDTSLFGNYRDNIEASDDYALLHYEFTTVQDYPAMWLSFKMKNENQTFYNKVLNIHRGNRIYYLFITAQDALASKPAIDSFFTSFSLSSIRESAWSQQWAPDNSFSTWAAAPVERYYDSTEEKSEVIYDMYDATAPVTFYIRKTAYPEFFWTESDTALLRREAMQNVGYRDSLLGYDLISNGNYKGVDLLIQLPDNHNRKKIRMLLVGDTLFTIYGITSADYLQMKNVQRFFTDFRVNRAETPTTLFRNKARPLLDALLIPDSATHVKAQVALQMVSFGTDELPLLHERMLYLYPDSLADGSGGFERTGNRTNSRLFNIVSSLADNSSIEFIRTAYPALPPEKDNLRFGLLQILASFKTAESYSLLKELLVSKPPKSGRPYLLYAELSDSLSLAAQLFPAILPLLNDSLNKWSIITLAENLLDSNLLPLHQLAEHKKELYAMAEGILKKLQTELYPEQWYNCHIIIRMLAKFGQPEDIGLIRQFLNQKNSYLIYAAATNLLKNNQPVEAALLTKLAAKNEHRIDLYNFLLEIKQASLFPKKYLTQQQFAESEVYTNASDDNEVKSITFIGERKLMYEGSLKKFYLFKVDVSYEEDKVIRLGIAGPYPVQSSKIVTESTASGLYWAKDFDAKTIDADVKEYLEKREE